MITLLLATLVASPTITYQPTWSSSYRNFPSQNLTIDLNDNYSGQAYSYELLEAYSDIGLTKYKIDMGGNVFDFAIYSALEESGGYYRAHFYFATSELYHSNIFFSNLSAVIYDEDNTGQEVPNTKVALPNVYFYQSNARRVSDNPIVSGYQYYYGDYDDDKYYFEKPVNTDYQLNDLVLHLNFDIEFLPVEMVNGSEYQTGYNDGWNNGNDNGFNDGYNNGYTTGYNEAYEYYVNSGGTATEIFSGIINVALLPINFFLACLNFEVFGINIGGFVSATLTIMIVIIIYRVIVSGGLGGGKSND